MANVGWNFLMGTSEMCNPQDQTDHSSQSRSGVRGISGVILAQANASVDFL
jgi:hypothetical protein